MGGALPKTRAPFAFCLGQNDDRVSAERGGTHPVLRIAIEEVQKRQGRGEDAGRDDER
jgi:hypothetical protein